MIKTILLVDDDRDIRETVAELLMSEGYQVSQASTGKEGLRALAAMPSDPCLVLLDMMMPEMNGWEFLDILGQAHRLAALPVVVVSGHPDEGRGLGARGLMRKPVSLEVLLDVVREFCGEA